MHRYYHSPVTVILHVCSPSRNKPTVTRVWIIYFPFLFLSPPLFEKQLGDSIIVFWSCIVAMAQQSKSTSLNRKGKENAPPPPPPMTSLFGLTVCLSQAFGLNGFFGPCENIRLSPFFPKILTSFSYIYLVIYFDIMLNKYTLPNTFV